MPADPVVLIFVWPVMVVVPALVIESTGLLLVINASDVGLVVPMVNGPDWPPLTITLPSVVSVIAVWVTLPELSIANISCLTLLLAHQSWQCWRSSGALSC